MSKTTSDLANLLQQGCLELFKNANLIIITDQQIQMFVNYLQLLAKWNQAYNLTAVREIDAMVSRHILDSLTLVPYLEGKYIIDVGSGPGLPGIPLAIVFPHKQFVLLDSNGKKARFMTQAIQELSLPNVKIINQRAEAFTINPKFDTVISRAFASLENLLAHTRHLCNNEGQFLAMKGIYPAEEVTAVPEDFLVTAVHKVSVPYLAEQRHIVCIKFRTELWAKSLQ